MSDRPLADVRPDPPDPLRDAKRIQLWLECRTCGASWTAFTPYWWAKDDHAHPCVEAGHNIVLVKSGGVYG